MIGIFALNLQHELSGNFNVLVAENGAKALDILLKENVSLVVSDVMMPEMNGFELCPPGLSRIWPSVISR